MIDHPKESTLIPPYGGRLVNLLAEDEEKEELLARSSELPSLRLSRRAMCGLELLATGGFSPLDRFMGNADYMRVLTESRLVLATTSLSCAAGIQ